MAYRQGGGGAVSRWLIHVHSRFLSWNEGKSVDVTLEGHDRRFALLLVLLSRVFFSLFGRRTFQSRTSISVLLTSLSIPLGLLFCFVLFYCVIFRFILFYFVSFHFDLFYFVLIHMVSYFGLLCFVSCCLDFFLL